MVDDGSSDQTATIQEAVLESDEVDLIVLDLNLDNGNGLEWFLIRRRMLAALSFFC